MRKLLVICGILAPLIYVGTDVIAALRYPGYNFTDQAVSELFAVGAPTAYLVVPLFSLSSVLLLAFAFGVWISSGQSRWLRFMALMFFGNAINSLLLWNFFPMHMRGAKATFTDVMHAILAINPFVLLSIVAGAAAFRNWFRYYSTAIIFVLVIPALFAFHYVSEIATDQATPGLGAAERIAQYGHQLWQALLAFMLIPRKQEFDG